MMRLALYRGRTRLFDRAVQWWTRGPYSHAELVFSDGMAATASARDGGVRLKQIDWNPERWVFVDLPGDETSARAWFNAHLGQRYDYLGLFGFLWRPHIGNNGRWFCSEAIAAALGMADAWRFCPNILAVALQGRQEAV